MKNKAGTMIKKLNIGRALKVATSVSSALGVGLADLEPALANCGVPPCGAAWNRVRQRCNYALDKRGLKGEQRDLERAKCWADPDNPKWDS